MNTSSTSSLQPREAYDEIKQLTTKVETISDPADAEMLIEKSTTFIKAHGKYKHAAEVYYILGSTLVEFDRAIECIAVLEELIKYYPLASYVEPSLLILGLAYDKVDRHDEADVVYAKLINNSKYSNGRHAQTAQKLLQTDRADRKGVTEGLASTTNSAPNFVGQIATDFDVTDLNGKPLSLAQFQGKVVLLDFWATWCPPCIAEMPNVKRTYEKYKNQKFQIIGISLDRGKAPLEAYIEKEGITWPQYYDNSRQISNMYQVQAIPSTFLIDADGIIRKTNLRGGALETAVAQLVQENMARQRIE
jgi:peroxiredoxin